MLRVYVAPNPQPETRSGKNSAGREWSFRQQAVRIYEAGTPFADKFVITLPEDVTVYPEGEYLLDLNVSFERGSFDSLTLIRQTRLIPFSVENLAIAKKSFDAQFLEFSNLLKKTA